MLHISNYLPAHQDAQQQQQLSFFQDMHYVHICKCRILQSIRIFVSFDTYCFLCSLKIMNESQFIASAGIFQRINNSQQFSAPILNTLTLNQVPSRFHFDCDTVQRFEKQNTQQTICICINDNNRLNFHNASVINRQTRLSI